MNPAAVLEEALEGLATPPPAVPLQPLSPPEPLTPPMAERGWAAPPPSRLMDPPSLHCPCLNVFSA